MRIDVLFFEGCPHHEATLSLVRKVVADVRPPAEIHAIEVKTPEEAQRLRFLGSPTVQVDGRDIDPMAAKCEVSFACRLYGRSGVPPREMIEAALQSIGRSARDEAPDASPHRDPGWSM